MATRCFDKEKNLEQPRPWAIGNLGRRLVIAKTHEDDYSFESKSGDQIMESDLTYWQWIWAISGTCGFFLGFLFRQILSELYRGLETKDASRGGERFNPSLYESLQWQQNKNSQGHWHLPARHQIQMQAVCSRRIFDSKMEKSKTKSGVIWK